MEESSLSKQIRFKKYLKRFNLRIFKRLPAAEKKITVSTMLTFVRILLTPFIVYSMIAGYWGAAFIMFVTAAVTDVLDGSIARLLNQKTFLGACLDPLADKLLLLSCFMTLAFVETPLFSIPTWFVWLVLSKELLQWFGALFIYTIKGHLEVRPTILGKLTTVVQVTFIIWLFACYFFQWVPVKTYWAMLSLMIVMVCMSFVQYARMGIRFFKFG